MKVLVTGGTGVIGESSVRALHRRGHTVRVLSRHAGRGEQWWPEGVDGWPGDVSNEKSIRGAAEGCDVVLHIAGIVDEQPPTRTFQSVNIDGTRYVVLEAERAGVKRVVFVSSLGAERGRSGYHKSKCVAEDVVRAFSREWVVVRPGAVYGPGDENISMLLRMVRSLPVIPTIGDGEQKFQPIWHEDLAEVLALAVDRSDVRCRVLEVAGPEVTSQNDLTARLRTITNRAAVQAPLPELFASWGIRALEAIGVDVPFTESQMHMLSEGNFIQPGAQNALTDVFNLAPTRLDEGLRRLATEQPEQHPSSGVGTLTRKRYWVDIHGGRYDADALFDHVRHHLPTLLPSIVTVKVEPAGATRMDEGATLTLEIPVRGQVQVRVAEAADRRMTLLTVAGHPIAGAARFLLEPRGDAVRFEIQVYDRAATVLDEVMLRTVGDWLQRGAWIGLAENVARAAGGTSTGVQSESEELDDAEMQLVDEWAKTLSEGIQRSRKSTSTGRD
ncbi:MAG: NAD-dependent epimerase/dehydratase [Gemmatimonadetes bacterium]|nr:NAD-dependent epimerase/dehydratase [Gemmatimonadota bacterium]